MEMLPSYAAEEGNGAGIVRYGPMQAGTAPGIIEFWFGTGR